jgi:error-prone DNA polymerase
MRTLFPYTTLFRSERLTVTRHRFLMIDGLLQNNDGVVHVKANNIRPLDLTAAVLASHDFH